MIRSCWFAPMAMLLLASLTAADERGPLTEARSRNNRFVLEIQPGRAAGAAQAAETEPPAVAEGDDGSDASAGAEADEEPAGAGKAAPAARTGGCRAVLKERGERRGVYQEVWQAALRSDVAPAMVQIRDDGEFVVTLDEYRRGGARHALVIYDAAGKAAREFDLRELLTRDDWGNVHKSGQAIDWISGAKFAFKARPEQFVIRLRWGRQIIIDLETLEIHDRPHRGEHDDGEAGAELHAGAESGDAEIPEELLALLEGDAAFETELLNESIASAEELAASEIEEPMESGEALPAHETVELANASITEPIAGIAVDAAEAEEEAPPEPLVLPFAEMINAAAGAAVEHTVLAADPSPESSPNVDSGAAISAAVGQSIGDRIAHSIAEAIFSSYFVPSAGISAEVDVPVPLPNPQTPVDYAGWLLEQTKTPGPSAGPLLREATASVGTWTGDEELRSRALAGDPAALASPEIIAWLDSNQAALDKLREAGPLDHSGFEMQSVDGSLIGFLLPEMAPMRELTRAAVVDAARLDAEGDALGAMQRRMDALRAGAQISHGPTLIENLVGVAMQAMAAESTLDAMAVDHVNTDYAALAAGLRESYGSARSMSETVQFERAMVMDALQRAFEYDAETGATVPSASSGEFLRQVAAMAGENDPLRALAVVHNVASAGLDGLASSANEHYDALTRALQQPYPQARQALGELEARVAAADFQAANPLLATLLPSLSRANFIGARAETNRRATLLVAQIRAFEQQTGAPPESLDDLALGDAANDPFTGQPFAYRRDGSSFSLYSLGDNGVDDGGVHDRRAETNDVVFWPRPPKGP